jgi:hypothetical protein
MAEQTRRRRSSSSNGEAPPPAPESDTTKRVVLRRHRAILLPDSMTDEHAVAAEAKVAEVIEDESVELAPGDREQLRVVGEAWVVIGHFEGKTKTNAIEAHAGKPNTPDAKPGAYKAPGVSAWSGGELYERPPEPKVERKALD